MAEKRPSFRCTECGYAAAKWVGRCPECQAWGTLAEHAPTRTASLTPSTVSAPARPIAEIDVNAARAISTGVSELDRVLGGGVVPGAVVLLAGEPGVGKSTLLLEVANSFASTAGRALVITGEESAAQVRLRAERIGALNEQVFLAAETELGALIAHVDAVKPRLLIVDSIQTISSSGIDGSPGGVTQVRAVTAALIACAKERGIATVIVGHVTKDGGIAGPRMLEHLVDVVLYFEGDRHAALRLIRAVKNRFGPADETGCFHMYDGGIRSVEDPSGLFTSDRKDPVPGTCVAVTLEGRRPLPVEVQALVASSSLATPRRAVSGLDAARLAMVLAVLERRGKIRLGDRDIFAATVGGVRVTEPAIDLAIALSVASAARDAPLPGDLVALGEVGLSGDVRQVTSLGRRLTEAARLGFRSAIVPAGCAEVTAPPTGLVVLEVANLGEALRHCQQRSASQATAA